MNRRLSALWLSLAVLLALIQYGMSTARLGEKKYSYGVLDDTVRPYLLARYVICL